MTPTVGATQRLRDLPGFLRFWTATTVSGFGTYVTSVAIQVLVVITLHEGATYLRMILLS